MSMFEKLSLVEKVSDETAENTTVQEERVSEDKVIKESEGESKVILEETPNFEESTGAEEDFINHEKNMEIEEIYSLYGIENSNLQTVFMLGNYINALPENLPQDIKKSSVINILNVSSIDLNKLLSDGEKRLGILDEFMQEYQQSIQQTISGYKAQIEKLSKLIDQYNDQIQIRRTMLEEQNHMVKYETQKINNIVSFFRNDS